MGPSVPLRISARPRFPEHGCVRLRWVFAQENHEQRRLYPDQSTRFRRRRVRGGLLLPLELAEAELKAKPAAAVMAILRDGPRGLEVVLGERTKREGDPWSGQIGLPGGRHRDEDPTMLATALRETKEEVGIDLEGRAEILAHMPPRAPGNKPEVLVVPYVALATEPIEATPGPEMASVFWVPLEALPATHGTSTVTTILGELSVPAYTT